jgi:hypothetical protein
MASIAIKGSGRSQLGTHPNVRHVQPSYTVSIMEIKDWKVACETASRAQWVELMR